MDSDFDIAESWKDLTQEEIYDLLMKVIGILIKKRQIANSRN